MQVQIGQQNKNCGTKTAEQKLVGTLGHWVTGTPSASAKRSVEQKLVSRTKTAEQKLVGRTKKRSAEQKLVSRTKKRSAEQKLVDTVSHCRDPKCKCKKVSRTKIAEQKLVGTFGHWVTGTPSASAKRSVEQKLVSGTKIGKCKCKKVSGTKIAEQKLWNKNWWGLSAIG